MCLVDNKKKKPCDVPAAAVDLLDFNTMDYESLVAALTDDAMVEAPPPTSHPSSLAPRATTSDSNNYSTSVPANTQVHYYYSNNASLPQVPSKSCKTPLQQPRSWEPRLLLRQSYKVSTQADAVIGLECSLDFKASIYLVSSQTSVNISIEDLIGLRTAANTIDKYFDGTVQFPPMYFNSVLLETAITETGEHVISLSNFEVRVQQSTFRTAMGGGKQQASDNVCQSPAILLHSTGWSAFKRLFDCIEVYFNILQSECSPSVQYLTTRYCKYFVRHYQTLVQLKFNEQNLASNQSALKLPVDTVRHISTDLPLVLAELNEKRISSSDQESQWFESTPSRQALLPWIDAEVRRFCVPNICDNVLQDLKYCLRKW